ncbi:uncharacterized protein TRAVEDRAFT_122509 [Trametes versicolor FP-101664 SS1]|uniref:uncharacterized protein n=1 Tax=Trametes versicolor (strain FP-101664) TaxID=717944 RepID=UPI0004622611|nr:uncharacterized protein TRAVEDRAFT_122509 [Trametes versicolor FP-101664 SS1]EIW59602.1 hypothetical protein TRAVEDRAFT_122509 [Trametes versicolor FP-101664 SS1]
MDTEEPAQEAAEVPEVALAEKRAEAAPAKAKKAKAPETLITREPGKSVLPFSRVQKILKADKDLCMVQREAAFLISLATEDFVARFTEAIQRSAGREGRATVQGKDVITTVRRAEEFAFLEELFPWSSLEAPAKRKPKALQEKEKGTHGPTMLDQFVSKPTRDDGEGTDEEDVPLRMNIVTNEDGTLSMGPAESEPS